MLKKLVKYGNSNALILDKAILQLLNIEEGSIIKIKTDGKSIIITPHVKVESEKINETFTHNQASIEAGVKESFKRYIGLHKDEQEKLEKEFLDLIQRNQNLQMQLIQNPDFLKEVSHIAKKIDTSSDEYLEAYKALRNKYAPELTKVKNEIATFKDRKKLKPMHTLSAKQQKAMEKEFTLHFQKYSNTGKMYAELLNNEEYQHKAQLIAEKYNFNKDSSGYLRAIDQLTNKYHPEAQKPREALRAISEKYLKNTK